LREQLKRQLPPQKTLMEAIMVAHKKCVTAPDHRYGKMTRAEYLTYTEKTLEHTERELKEINVFVEPCNCSSAYCPGWILKNHISKNRNA
jgi:hypothetical protein